MSEKKESKFSLDLSPDTKKNILGVIFLFIAVFFALSFFKPAGINLAGRVGENVSRVIILLFGYGSWLIVILFFFLGTLLLFPDLFTFPLARRVGGIGLLISIFSILELSQEDFGGYFGKLLTLLPMKYTGKTMSFFLFSVLFLISVMFLFNIPIFKLIFEKARQQKIRRGVGERVSLKEGEVDLKVKEIFPQREKRQRIKAPIPKIERRIEKGIKYKILPLALLESEETRPIAGNLRNNAQIIKKTLKTFGIEVEMGKVNIGPTVTQYTLRPAEGVKLSGILALRKDLSLSLASHPIRIEAPIPGKSLVGIEVPNQKRADVRLKSLLSQPEFLSFPPLIFPIGKDVMGKPYFADLSSMPHLLVAGATGTGKTVFLNSLILSLLWKNSPEDLRFILIDPKRVEFTLYYPLPHLLCPPIVRYEKVIPVLRCLVKEMERRFEILHESGSRDIESYNKKQRMKRKKGKKEDYKVLPYIIFVVDELADIMAAKGKEFEAGIVRLAQMSRAVGIHLVLATQRPSVEVLTGLIKANITSRIAFQVASQVDSRTILDMAGAEQLLGRGDMLFLSAEAAKPRRFQAPFVLSSEIKRVVEYLGKVEKEGKEEIEECIQVVLKKKVEKETGFLEFKESDEELYEEAKRVVIQARKASASLLQRRLKIGYARAARILDMLEERGVVGPLQGSKPREVYPRQE